MAANAFLGVAKGLAGVLAHSPALMADAAHSMSDVLADAVTVVAMRQARAAPTDVHPWGMGKMETLGTMSLAGVLVVTGGGLAATSAQTMLGMPEVAAGATDTLWVALAAAVGSIGAKEGLFQWTMANAAKSRVMQAHAWHHRSDALSSAAEGTADGLSVGEWHRVVIELDW